VRYRRPNHYSAIARLFCASRSSRLSFQSCC